MSVQIINDDYKKHFDLLNEDDVIVIDPPFNVGYKYNTYKDNMNETDYYDMLYELLHDRKCEAIMLKYGRRTFKYGDNNYSIRLNNANKQIKFENWRVIQHQECISFDSEELAQKAIDEIGKERLKKYVFQVEE